MKPFAYYNDNDPHVCAWVRELIKLNLISDGEVDSRSIKDIHPSDLLGFRRVHFFCGIAGWDLALNLAGWGDREVWTGSPPCQPFSVAGKGKGESDERHLWPAFFNLIRERRPDVVFGEQVEAAVGHGWLDGIRADLEGEGYACGDVTLGAHSVCAPHQRQRLYWVADAHRALGAQHEREPGKGPWREAGPLDASICGGLGAVADAGHEHEGRAPGSSQAESRWPLGEPPGCGHPGFGLDYGQRERCAARRNRDHGGDVGQLSGSNGEDGPVPVAYGIRPRLEGYDRNGNGGGEPGRLHAEPTGSVAASGGAVRAELPAGDGREQRRAKSGWRGSVRGCSEGSFWADSVLILCRDGKHRRIPAEPALFPLADGLPYKLARGRSARAALLRGAGNAIVPQVAAQFVRAFMDITE